MQACTCCSQVLWQDRVCYTSVAGFLLAHAGLLAARSGAVLAWETSCTDWQNISVCPPLFMQAPTAKATPAGAVPVCGWLC